MAVDHHAGSNMVLGTRRFACVGGAKKPKNRARGMVLRCPVIMGIKNMPVAAMSGMHMLA